jgi:repressor LexA
MSILFWSKIEQIFGIYVCFSSMVCYTYKKIGKTYDRRIHMSFGKISKKQEEILSYIKDEILKRGYPPAVREICEAVNLKSTSSVHAHLETLEKNGYIRRDPTKPRAIEIVDDSFHMVRHEMASIPILGTVAAGQPILAQENIEGYFPIPAEMVPQGDVFVLKVKGDSMINVGIFNGDQIFVEACETARNGDTVVALVEDSATVKTFYKENGYIRLQPENDTMEPIIVKDCKILGKVFGVFRLY